ncbi:MAG TPA: HD domain-containing protein [Candidatus Saccharimonadales bacterium]|nr:HD domain-containing protein [Candidatus Saccharimonadales bacterium]
MASLKKNINHYSSTQISLIKSIEKVLEEQFKQDSSGHDWLHIQNTRKLALRIAHEEPDEKNLYVIELAALLHDFNDWKFKAEHTEKQTVRQLLEEFGVEPTVVEHVSFITENLSYKGGTNKVTMETIEGKIVQDADRLEAIGAIGITRACMFGGNRSLVLYDPFIKPQKFDSFKKYKKYKNTVINHFYEKLLLLKDQFHTKTAKRIAQGRHDFMLEFLDRFYKEIEGEL